MKKCKIYLFIVIMLISSLLLSSCFLFNRKYNVSGKVTDESGNGIANVRIMFSGSFGEVFTDDNGCWEKIGLKGIVTVTPVKENLLFTPENRQVSGASEQVNFVSKTHKVFEIGETTVSVPSYCSDDVTINVVTDYPALPEGVTAISNVYDITVRNIGHEVTSEPVKIFFDISERYRTANDSLALVHHYDEEINNWVPLYTLYDENQNPYCYTRNFSKFIVANISVRQIEVQDYSSARNGLSFANAPSELRDIDNYLELITPYENERGMCFGMCLLSLLLYDEELLPGPYFDISDTVWTEIDALHHHIDHAYKNYPEERFFIDEITFETVKQLHETQDVHKVNSIYTNIKTHVLPIRTNVIEVNDLVKSITKGEPAILFLNGYGENKHAVIAYKVKYNINEPLGKIEITVYDPNFPGQEKILEIDNGSIQGKYGEFYDVLFTFPLSNQEKLLARVVDNVNWPSREELVQVLKNSYKPRFLWTYYYANDNSLRVLFSNHNNPLQTLQNIEIDIIKTKNGEATSIGKYTGDLVSSLRDSNITAGETYGYKIVRSDGVESELNLITIPSVFTVTPIPGSYIDIQQDLIINISTEPSGWDNLLPKLKIFILKENGTFEKIVESHFPHPNYIIDHGKLNELFGENDSINLRFLIHSETGDYWVKDVMYRKKSDNTPVFPVGLGLIAAGDQNYSLALTSDNTVWSWGDNSEGQLGDGNYTDTHTPVQVQGLNSIEYIAAGWDHSLFIKTDGTIWACGDNYNGQLGNGTFGGDKYTPAQVEGIFDVISVDGGQNHSLAIKADGTVWAWGDNSYGELGDGTNTDKCTPVEVYGLADILMVEGGYSHSLALKYDGTVWSWGNNVVGQLGDGTNTNKNTPVQVQGLTGIEAISAGGEYHSLALKFDGTVWAWGYNVVGQLGDGTDTNKNTPVQVQGLTGIEAISAGGYHSLALSSDGTVWAWGGNLYGQLGNGTNSNSSIPVQVLELTGVIAISAAGNHSLALRSDGTVWAWGSNSDGQLGDGTTTNKNTPIQVKKLI